ncbi:MAG: type IV toxin-antitoxin system AbiEi family antitoxin domain-containing protein [Acidimicrobiia bacterium]
MNNTTLHLLNRLAQMQKTTFTSAEAAEIMEKSPQATSNLLTRLARQGLVARVTRGIYMTRAPGLYGTSPVSENVLIATRAALGNTPHRVSFRSALSFHGVLTHPSRRIDVASPKRIQMSSIAGWPLDAVFEYESTLAVGALPSHDGLSSVSTIERALLESTRSVERVGGVDVVADALDSLGGNIDVEEVRRLAKVLRLTAALQRLASIAHRVGYQNMAKELLGSDRFRRVVTIESGGTDPGEYTDTSARVAWSTAALDQVPAG